MAYNNLRIGGLASGLDVDKIVGDLMKAERVPLDKLRQDRQVEAWKQEDYRSMNTALTGLKDNVFNMKLQSTYLARTASSSNETAVTASAGASAVDGVNSITITNLATGVNKTSTATLADEKNADGTTKTLWQQFQTHWESELSPPLTSADNISVTINGTALTFDLDVDNVYTVASKINEANLGLKASYDATLDRFFLSTTTTGASVKIEITSDSARFLSLAVGDTVPANALKLDLLTGTIQPDGKVDPAGPLQQGVNASYNLNDATGLSSAANTFTVNGVTYTLKQGGGATASITVNRDANAVYNSIKTFVDKYNETLDKINTELNEERFRDYPPLTDEQKEGMKDSDIKLWEDKARSGMLHNDSMLQDITGNLRYALAIPVDDLPAEVNMLSVIGITTGSYTSGGKLYIDESKLRKAITGNPDGVMKLFTQTSGLDGETDTHKGVAVRLYAQLGQGIKRLSDYAGSTSNYNLVDNSFIGQELKGYDDRIADMEERLQDIEDRYWKKFTALEQAVSRANTQSAWLSQQFGGGSTSK